jgi:hypothetical protein
MKRLQRKLENALEMNTKENPQIPTLREHSKKQCIEQNA